MRFTKKNVIKQYESKFDAITKRPEMWGASLEAVELQALMVLEGLNFVKNGKDYASRATLDLYGEFLHKNGAGSGYLHSIHGMNHQKLAKLLIKFKKQSEL